MKVFDSEDGFDCKVNFVDQNNVFVGYDMWQNCCETAGWTMTDRVMRLPDTLPQDNVEDLPDMTDYCFDKTFFVDACELFGQSYADTFDGGGHVVFRLVSPSGPDMYLNIYNSHNGYYAHGFEYGECEGEVKTGVL